jgi:hypothetical protein
VPAYGKIKFSNPSLNNIYWSPETLKRIFDKKISDKTIKGYDVEEVKRWLSNVREIDSLKYYGYRPGAKHFSESQNLKKRPTDEVLSFLNSHFLPESPDFFVEIQQKIWKSGKWEIVFRGKISKGEITKLAVLNFQGKTLI